MKLLAGQKHFNLPEKIEPYSAKLYVFSNPDRQGVRYSYQVVHIAWHEFDELSSRLGNKGRTGQIQCFAVSPSHQEIHFFPAPSQDVEAKLRYTPAAKEL